MPQLPVLPVGVMVQSIPAGWEVTRPPPLPSRPTCRRRHPHRAERNQTTSEPGVPRERGTAPGARFRFDAAGPSASPGFWHNSRVNSAMGQVWSGLDAVDWAGMDHAYGPATQVPEHFYGLLANDPLVRERWLEKQLLYKVVDRIESRVDDRIALITGLLNLADAHLRIAVCRMAGKLIQLWRSDGYGPLTVAIGQQLSHEQVRDAAAIVHANAHRTHSFDAMDPVGDDIAFQASCRHAIDRIGARPQG